MIKKIYYLAITILLASSCATVRVSENKVIEEPRFFTSLVVVTSSGGIDFTSLSEDFYNNSIKPNFNKLASTKIREQYQRSMSRNFQPTPLRFMEDYFEVQADVSFEEYMEKLENDDSKGILVVDQRNYWQNVRIVNGNTRVSDNASFNCFLLDKDTLEVVWMGNFRVNGSSLSGYDVIHNHLMRNIVRRLHRHNLIAKMAKP
ncbi:hypothetical protein ACFOUP_14240 [Belliella kenyensis]|uniref:DUF4136 domain-containing protein n=1 Tax=Belliella kenyensis TaxID=1472724 RepID=A0ABV8ERA2_9BACT|nr:hypothetical protein [Belliella kenyensis]MCH7401604.1 hypothetical protein [Belliella kenyensis]MDN3603116.1 hypothetical protein [Belliella kenyensis]